MATGYLWTFLYKHSYQTFYLKNETNQGLAAGTSLTVPLGEEREAHLQHQTAGWTKSCEAFFVAASRGNPSLSLTSSTPWCGTIRCVYNRFWGNNKKERNYDSF